MTSERIAIAAHGWSVGIDRAIGGAITHARRGGRDVLRPAPPGAIGPLDTACFALVPYANRIAGGRFAFAGREHRLPRNFGDHPHSLHGTGWRAAWRVADRDAAALTLRHDHAPDAHWPWHFLAEQCVAIDVDGLTITLRLTNTDTTAMPAGVGLHPYFPAHADARLTLHAAGVWLADATQLPTERVAADRFGDWAAGAQVARDTLVDNAWDGWDGRATIADATGTTTIATSGAPVAHLFIPPGAGFLCVEPVSHLPDAVNRGGMPVLTPGETARLAMTIAYAAA